MQIELMREQKRSYTKQIYLRLREKVLAGELKAEEKLPSTRAMAAQYRISRNTVLTAYEMLGSEGLVRSVPGSGVYVSRGFRPAGPVEQIETYREQSLSDIRIPEGTVSFDSGIPALDLFPRAKWNRFFSRALSEAPVQALGYDDPQGRPELRRVLADYLKRSRGIRCHPDQIVVTSGAKQGLTLIAKCLLDSQSRVLLEDPTNDNVRRIFSYHTGHLTPVPVDGDGIRTDLLPAGVHPTLLFVTPSHQFPMGGILPLDRRMELIRFARQAGCYLLEDDYDSEFRYDALPVRSLYELDGEMVVYAGTFSKVLFPSLRLGYLVLPRPLVEQCRELKRLGDHHTDSISQLALMRFVESGELERHILRMKKLYRRRRDTLLEMLDALFGDRVRICGGAAGMHVVAGFEGADFTPEFLSRVLDAGLYLVPVEHHALVKDRHTGETLLGYAHLGPEEMERGLGILKTLLEEAP